uniref:Leucine-rich repeat and death domain-containing protein 1-like n=1 Tax=Hirondellea gigas TaxID=1518452 RepID=A0A2P2HWB4_9CRUS
MRITCDVSVLSRQLAGHSNMRQPRAVRSSLAICRQGTDAVLHHCTAHNKQGNEYKVLKNLVGVFSKFAKEGKFTIRLKEPKLDLVVKTDPLQAQGFLKTLKACVTGTAKVQLSNVAPVTQSHLIKPKTSMVVNSKQEYPITTAFPYSLEHLMVNNCSLTHIEARMLRLKRLQSLILTNNCINELPRAVTAMQCLRELSLPGNRIDRLHPDIFDGPIANTLSKLDLSNNEIMYLPRSVLLLQHLATLSVGSNKLRRLPHNIFRMRTLKYLDISSNNLDSLPFCLSKLRLQEMKARHNPFDLKPEILQENNDQMPSLLSLLELSLRKCASNKLVTGGIVCLPRTLRDSIRFCCRCDHCSAPIMQHCILTTRTNNFLLAEVIRYGDEDGNEVFLGYFCSKSCAFK